MKVKDMPKLKSPFVRMMDKDNEYVLTPEIDEECKWFQDDDVIATEKLDGTCVSIVVQEGTVMAVYNRAERIPFINKPKKHIIEGILNSCERGFIDKLGDGQHFGELIGEKVNSNPYQIGGHLWVPFETYCKKHLRYKSWGKYPKDFDTISNWFKDDLLPLFAMKKGRKDGFVEGIVFHKTSTGQMCKLRKDMFKWYKEKSHHRRKQK